MKRAAPIRKRRAADRAPDVPPADVPLQPVPIDGAPMTVRLSDVRPEPVSWLWPGRIALGKLTLIAGDPGLGKSFLTLDMAARVSMGRAWPDAPGVATTPGGVVLLNAEDGVADTIRPRLEAAGADLGRIVALAAIRSLGVNGRESARMFDLSRDLTRLEETIGSEDGCRLVVIDPVTAYLGGVDSHKNAEVRGLLAQLSAIAERHRVAVVAVTHLNKSGGGPAIYRAMGSLAFAAAARAAWAVSKDKDDPRRRLLLPIKNNIAPDTGGLAYRIESLGVDGCPVVAWEPDPVNVNADDALASDRAEGGGRTERDDAADWLRDYLGNGSKLARDVLIESKAAGFSKRTIDRAKPAAGVRTRKEAFGGGWVWELGAPDQERPSYAEDCHTPDGGNLGPKPDESRVNRPKIATLEGLATLGASGGNLGGADAGDGGGAS
ncbi:MAG: AAA family ATPase [Phycisphaerales bacterium]|nr:AAA family ATPase [Phycisphaerales bacterium]